MPTWNYEVVHVHGRVAVHHDTDWKRAMVGDLTDHHEAHLPAGDGSDAWEVADPAEFIDAQLKSIVGIELTVLAVDAKQKLSQNKPEGDRAGAAAGLAGTGHQQTPRLPTACGGPPSGEPTRHEQRHRRSPGGHRNSRTIRERTMTEAGIDRGENHQAHAASGGPGFATTAGVLGRVGAVIQIVPEVVPRRRCCPRAISSMMGPRTRRSRHGHPATGSTEPSSKMPLRRVWVSEVAVANCRCQHLQEWVTRIDEKGERLGFGNNEEVVASLVQRWS